MQKNKIMNSKANFQKLFSRSKALIGMIHLQALPGTPKANYSVNEIIDLALQEASILSENGFHGLMIENMHDVPYCKKHNAPEIIATMAIIARAIKQNTKLPLGIQILAAANEGAIAAAHAAQADFVRAEGFVYGHIADEGYIDSCAGSLLRYRKQIGAEHIAVYTDIKKKHSAHTLTADVDIVETAKAAEFFLSDGLIVTGQATGSPVLLSELTAVQENVTSPVFIGSGIDHNNLAEYFSFADGFIVGSSLKQDGYWANALDVSAVKKLAEVFHEIENHHEFT